MIARKSIDEVIERARIEDVVQDYLPLKRRGVNMIGLCPFHNEKTPSFNVSPAKNIYKCFGCGKAGDPVSFIMEHDQVDFPEAIRHLAIRYNIELTETELNQEAKAAQLEYESNYLLNGFALQHFQEQLLQTDAGKSIGLRYFRDRGFTPETIERFGLGFAPDATDLLTHKAKIAGYKLDHLQKLGLTSQYGRDFFRDRVMFTIHNLSGKPIAFAGRILAKDVKAPKYINSPETEIYQKSKVLYAMHLAKKSIRQLDECILVEGYTDVISMHQRGMENVVASSGTSLTVEQIQLIKRFTENITVLYDGDKAGLNAALRGTDMILEQGLNVKIVLLPEGEDPDSFVKQVNADGVREYIRQQAKDVVLFKATLLREEVKGDPIKKSKLIKDIILTLAKIPDPIKRSVYVKESSQLLDIEEAILIDETNKEVHIRFQKNRAKPETEETAPFPSEPQYEQQIPIPVSPTATTTTDFFQEKDLIRVLISSGSEWINESENIRVADLIIANLQDILDGFETPIHRKIIDISLARLQSGSPLHMSYFTANEDDSIRKLTFDLLSTPYTYSENWANKWETHLSQPMPEKNFLLDAQSALKRFRIRKINRLLHENQVKMQNLNVEQSPETWFTLMKVHQKLLEMRNLLANELGDVVYY